MFAPFSDVTINGSNELENNFVGHPPKSNLLHPKSLRLLVFFASLPFIDLRGTRHEEKNEDTSEATDQSD